MQPRTIGLGRMRASTVWRLRKRGHSCVVHDVQPAAVAVLAKYGATGAVLPKEMVSQLGQPRTLWLKVPVPVPVFSAALFARFTSRGNADLTNRALSATRCGFGGHLETPPS